MDKNHKKKIKNLEVLWHSFSMMTELAMEYGIQDIFQDNNAKLVQQLIYLNFKALPGREGNDALDEKKRTYSNIKKTAEKTNEQKRCSFIE